jgi:hypothetical protein
MIVITLKIAVGSFTTHEEAVQAARPWTEIALPNDDIFSGIADDILRKIDEKNKQTRGMSLILVDCRM